MRLDAHQHFWQYSAAEYAWISEEMAVLRRDFLPDDLEPLLRSIGFDGCVAVEARQTLEETHWLLGLAEEHAFIKRVVGWVDLCSDELPAQLESLAAHPKLAGVRHLLQDEPDDRFMLRASFRRGIGRLREFNLAYDLVIHPRHLPATVELVMEFPEQRFVLDHLAKPPIASGELSPWREELQALAGSPNVHCKLSGMVTEAKWGQWRADDFRKYLDTVFAAFGPDRLMIGSDWPVCLLSANYRPAMQIVIDYIEQFPVESQAGILGENCARFYGIDRV